MKSLITFFLMFIVFGLNGQNLNNLYKESLKAYERKDYEQFKALTLQALELNPTQPTILYNLAVANALSGETEEAAEILNRLLSWNTRTEYLNNKDFNSLFADSGIMERLNETKLTYATVAVKSDLFVSLPNTSHLEDLVKIESNFFFTDVHSGYVYKYAANSKKSSVLVTLPLSAMAISEGVESKTIWVSTAALPQFKKDLESSAKPALYEIDINSGMVLNRVLLPKNAVAGSMVKAENELLYASNSSKPEIFVIDTNLKRLVKTIPINEGKNLQGIDLNFMDNKLYIADYIKGILILDLEQEDLQRWLNIDTYLLKGCDGVQFIDRRNLLVIQNNSTPKKVIKIMHIDGRVQNITLIDNKLPLKGEPTNGFYDQEEGFYYIANSQWPFYDKENNPLYKSWESQQIRIIPLSNLR